MPHFFSNPLHRWILQWKRQHCKLGLFIGAISMIKPERESSIKVSLNRNTSAACHLCYWPIIFSRLCYNFLTSVSGNRLKRKYDDSFSFNGSPVGCELWSLCWWLKGPHYLYTGFYYGKALLSCPCLYKTWLFGYREILWYIRGAEAVDSRAWSLQHLLLSTVIGSKIGFWMMKVKQWNTTWTHLNKAPGLELETKDLVFG